MPDGEVIFFAIGPRTMVEYVEFAKDILDPVATVVDFGGDGQGFAAPCAPERSRARRCSISFIFPVLPTKVGMSLRHIKS